MKSKRGKSREGEAAVAEWLCSWLAEQEDRGSIPGLATWIFRDWLSPASNTRYGWKIAKSTLILITTNQPATKSRRGAQTLLCSKPPPLLLCSWHWNGVFMILFKYVWLKEGLSPLPLQKIPKHFCFDMPNRQLRRLLEIDWCFEREKDIIFRKYMRDIFHRSKKDVHVGTSYWKGSERKFAEKIALFHKV